MLELIMMVIVVAVMSGVVYLQRETIKGYQDFINKNINERVIYTAKAYDNTERYSSEALEEEGEIGEEVSELTHEDKEGIINEKGNED